MISDDMGIQGIGGQLISFSKSDACEFGLDVAVFVAGLGQAIQFYAEQKLHGRDMVEVLVVEGETYAPVTLEDLTRLFPFWSSHQVRRVKEKAVALGVIKIERFNTSPWDRRLWYAVTAP